MHVRSYALYMSIANECYAIMEPLEKPEKLNLFLSLAWFLNLLIIKNNIDLQYQIRQWLATYI